MTGDREIIQEFLTSLGFRVDQPSLRSFMMGLKAACITASKLGATVVGVAVAAEAMVTVFARQQEKMYYLSKRSTATAGNLMALAFGFEQIGLSADEAKGLVDNMMGMIRTNPGLSALVRTMGVSTNQDPTKMFTGLIRQLAKLPYFIGAQWAQQFGIPEQVFRMLTLPGALDKLEEAAERQKKVYRDLKIDQDAAAQAGMEYMNTLRDVWTLVDALGASLSIKLLPYFRDFAAGVKEWLTDLIGLDWSNLEFSFDSLIGFVEEQLGRRLPEILKKAAQDIGNFIRTRIESDEKWTLGWWFKQNNLGIGGALAKLFGPGENTTFKAQSTGMPPGASAGAAQHSFSLSRKQLESWAEQAAAAAGVPPNILKAMIQKESAWDPNAMSEIDAKGRYAFGLTQLRGPAAQDMGVDRFDVAGNLTGGARYLAKQFAQFGNWRDALAAYNQGAGGDLTKGHAYADSIMKMSGGPQVSIQQTNDIRVASTDPEGAGRAVGREMDRVNADLVRNSVGAIR